MALILMDGFEYNDVYSSSLYGNWFYRNKVGIEARIQNNGRFGTRGVSIGINTWETNIGKVLYTNCETIIVGFGFRPDTFWGSGTKVLQLRDGGTIHVTLHRNPTNKDIYVTVGSSHTWLARSEYLASPTSVWQYLEVKVKVHDTEGTIEVRLNGQTVINLVNIDTRNGGNPYINTIEFGTTTDPVCAIIDDVYVCDTTGTTNNDFLGDVRVVKLLPSSNGSINNFIPSAGSNFQCVDEFLNDGDTTNVKSTTVGDIDLYQVSDLTVTPSNIYAVQIESFVRKTDTNIASFRNKMKIGEHIENDSERILALDYAPYDSPIYELDPSTSTPWTKEKIDSLEVGVERLS